MSPNSFESPMFCTQTRSKPAGTAETATQEHGHQYQEWHREEEEMPEHWATKGKENA